MVSSLFNHFDTCVYLFILILEDSLLEKSAIYQRMVKKNHKSELLLWTR